MCMFVKEFSYLYTGGKKEDMRAKKKRICCQRQCNIYREVAWAALISVRNSHVQHTHTL